jgi:hypothetical protein
MGSTAPRLSHPSPVGQPVPTSQAQGMLVEALAVLAAHYGLTRRMGLLTG